MTTLARTLSRAKTISLEMPAINWRRFYIIGLFLAVVLLFLTLVFYVYQVNELTKGNYTIRNYQKEIANLSSENAKLETSYAEVGFLGDIQKKASEMNFEKIKEIKYIQVLNSSLARAR